MKFYTRYDVPPSPGFESDKPSMTEQHFKDECNINNIVRQFEQTGVMPSGNREPLFGDFSDFPQDLMQSRALFDEAEERFMSLPSNVRKEFDNDPLALLAFLNDSKNTERAIELGLVSRPETVHSEDTNVSTPPSEEGKK